ncbi:alkaline phosphatase family protein [Desulfosporosinus metallidurans]|uniref:Nucleotide pyrophosphatase n=1 Tax=Desulfosporosinus metallidurans TaxID=1888891 RepID=A0A1Q8QI58_9FIRM|nr:alkaline phosphatase family protein [Desulfosporosinus metallidurans]OLN26958.1 hypothetical protein DSOL_4777 [Desulfosporosinus metallidurans]
MSLERTALSNKILILGIDGLDPRLTRKFVDEGKMPNTKKFIERGVAREDLVMLGGQPTVTPPMWTTLSTGAHPYTHGITGFDRQSAESLDITEYNLSSAHCKAEQLWNVFAEAGKRTLVWHWPGSAWPPTSNNPNLHVVDGTQPGAPNIGVAKVDKEKFIIADVKTPEVDYRNSATNDGDVPCMLTDLKAIEGKKQADASKIVAKQRKVVILNGDEEGGASDSVFDVQVSPVKEAAGWANAPEGAKEFILLHSEGVIRRPCLILKNPQGVYDKIAIYKNKKEAEPIVVLKPDVFTPNIVDEAAKDNGVCLANRCMRVLELAEDGTRLKLWCSSAMNISADSVWHPKSLFKEVCENVGYPQPLSLAGGNNSDLFKKCMLASWDNMGKWYGDTLNYFIEKDRYDVIFTHFHNVDLEGHLIIKYMKKGHKGQEGNVFQQYLEDVYIQTDNYIGQFLHLLDKEWTVFIISDHAQVCPEHDVPLIGDTKGTMVPIMRELGYTEVLKDENGNDLYEIDWNRTKAVATRANHIYLNIKGRYPHGIVNPEDQYELEEQIMTDLYGYKDKKTGKRIIAMALRNRDAILLGLGGPESGDILFWLAEGYNYDHCDSLSTTYGFADTSVSPIFIGAGVGLKSGVYTERMIREVDFAPTVAVVGGVRMPAQCEGAPAYQIFTKDY